MTTSKIDFIYLLYSHRTSYDILILLSTPDDIYYPMILKYSLLNLFILDHL